MLTVHSMPTFLILKNSRVTETIRGANPPALRAAVTKAAADAGRSGPATAAAFQSKGHVLGSEDAGKKPAAGGPSSVQAWVRRSGGGSWMDAAVRMLGLYLETLFSMDPRAAAEGSRWRVQGRG